MLRPERMAVASVICKKTDVETLLEALSSFGEFHIEETEENTSTADYSQEIQKAEESYSNVSELIKQLSQEKPGPLDFFKPPQKPTITQVTAENWQALAESTDQQISTLKKQVDDLNTSLSSLQEKTAQLNNVKKMITIIDEKHGDLEATQNLELIHVTAASIPIKDFEQLKNELAKYPVFLNNVALTNDCYFLSVAVPSKEGSEVDKILRAHHAEIYSIPKDLPHNNKDALKEVNSRLKDAEEKEKGISSSLHKLGVENRNNLPVWKENTENTLALLYGKDRTLQSGRLATIKGFVPKNKMAKLDEKVHSLLGEKAIVLTAEPEKGDEPPTSLRNNRFIKPFESITGLYGLPKYSEVDPTPILAFSFPIIFGLMFGDVGDGAILLLMGIIGFLILKKGGFKNLFAVLAMCGVAAIIFGFVYGESFGNPFGTPLWFDPFYKNPLTGDYPNVFRFLIAALYIGVAQIVLGISLEMTNYIINHRVGEALVRALPKLLFYGGCVYVISVYGLNLGAWFAGPAEFFIILPFFVMVLANPLYVTLGHRPAVTVSPEAMEDGEMAIEAQESSFSQSLFDGGDLMIRLLSNTVSYSRILALLTAHWALLLAFTQLNILVGGGALGFLMIAVGNALVLTLELLVVFIHTLRLHFYEWFSKFYGGSGKQFHPYKQSFVCTDVHLNAKKEEA